MTFALTSRRSFRVLLYTAVALTTICNRLPAEPVEDTLTRAHKCDAELKAGEALQCYLEVEKVQPENATVLVRIARQYRHLMADAKTDAEKRKLGELALLYGRKAAAVAPNDSDAQLSAAISYGKMLPLQSSKEQMEASRLVKAGADKAIKLNPRNDIAWHIAGRWHRGLAEIGTLKRAVATLVYGKLPEATYADAATCFEKAVELDPNKVIHQIELGRTYAEMGRKEEARQRIEKGLAMPNVEKDDPECKERGRKTLASLK